MPHFNNVVCLALAQLGPRSWPGRKQCISRRDGQLLPGWTKRTRNLDGRDTRLRNEFSTNCGSEGTLWLKVTSFRLGSRFVEICVVGLYYARHPEMATAVGDIGNTHPIRKFLRKMYFHWASTAWNGRENICRGDLPTPEQARMSSSHL
jgi:hypothetical protein